MMGDFEASISEGYLMCPIVHWLKVIGKFVYIILQLNKQINNIGAHPTFETDFTPAQHQNKGFNLFFNN
jgi:hypothetical protein